MKKSLSLLLSMLLVSAAIPVHAAAVTPSTISMTIVFKGNSVSANVKSAVLKSGGKIVSEIPEVGTMKIEGKSTLLDTLQSYSDVQAVSPTINFKLPETTSAAFTDNSSVNTASADLYNAYQWDIKQVTNNGASYDLGTGSHNTVVGIIDTGISQQHNDLKANLLGGENFVPDGPDGTVIKTDIEDKNGHGSHVAGSIAGNGRILGIAPNIGFKSYRVFAATGGTPTDRLLSAIIAATDDKVDVISMSIGGYDVKSQYTYTDPATGQTSRLNDVADFLAYQRAIKYAVSHGVVVVASAGNDATNCANKAAVTDFLNGEYGSEGYKFKGASFEVSGSIPGVIAVSATGPNTTLASYSNYGPGFIDVAAPGGDVYKPRTDPTWKYDLCLGGYKDGGYIWMAGTSMAAPKVSAVAALIIDQNKAKGINLTPSQITHQLYKTSVDLGKPGSDKFFGYGMVNAYTALK